MPRSLRKRPHQPSKLAIACATSDEEATKQLTEREVGSGTDVSVSDHEATQEADDHYIDGISSTKKKSVVRQKTLDQKKKTRTVLSMMNKSEQSEVKSEKGYKTSPITLDRPPRTPLHHDSRRAPQHKDGMLTALLGSHIPLQLAAAKSKVWSKEVAGPQSNFIAEHIVASELKFLPHILCRDNLDLVHVQDVHMYQSYLPKYKATDVSFIEAGSSQEHHEKILVGTACTTQSETVDSKSFTLHTGLSNQSADWVQSSQDTQYLVIGGKKEQAGATPLFDFASGPGTIQIWELLATTDQRACSLSVVFLHDYGTTWQVKWCPAISQNENVIGWLAAAFGDGIIRLWPVDKRPIASAAPELRKLQSPAYEFKVPETKCVKFDWLSEVSIAVACANGMYVVWDLTNSTDLPYTVAHPHSSFINNIATCGPSVHDIILTSSWDCDITFSHVRQSDTDYLSAARERMPVYALAWSDFLNSAVTNEDLSGVRNVAMRTGNSFSIATMAGTVTALATHAKHPFVAIGDASGAVMVVNLCRKVLWKKHEQFQRKIFQLDWTKETNTYYFIDGFRVEGLLSKSEAATVGVTNIYPHEICITDLVWNGNKGYEALLASCTTHFVRIDDLTTNG